MPGKVTIFFAQIEGPDEAIQGALSSFLNAAFGESVRIPVIGTAVDVPRALAHRNGKTSEKPPATEPQAVTEAVAPSRPTGQLIDRIQAALAKGPLTSKEVHAKIGNSGPIGSTYDGLHRMRKAGMIESVVDDKDGQRKNALKPAGGAAR